MSDDAAAGQSWELADGCDIRKAQLADESRALDNWHAAPDSMANTAGVGSGVEAHSQ